MQIEVLVVPEESGFALSSGNMHTWPEPGDVLSHRALAMVLPALEWLQGWREYGARGTMQDVECEEKGEGDGGARH